MGAGCSCDVRLPAEAEVYGCGLPGLIEGDEAEKVAKGNGLVSKDFEVGGSGSVAYLAGTYPYNSRPKYGSYPGDRRVSTVISGRQFRRRRAYMIPRPRLVYWYIFPTLYSPLVYLRASGGTHG